MVADDVAALLEGAVDLHVHPAPSPMPRRIDAAEAARLAGETGFKAIVVKSHHHNTVMDVLALEHAGATDGGSKVFGGVALNGQVGGINPSAVELCLKMGGRIVWFPTIASAKHIEHHAAHPNLKFPKLSVHLSPEQPVEVLDGALVGTHLSGGAHRVMLRYVPGGLWAGLGLSCLAALAIAIEPEA